MIAGTYVVEVTHPFYSDNSRMTEVSFDVDAAGVITENFLMAEFKLDLTADPTSILGNGTDKSLLTAVIKDKNGVPISGVELTFSAARGSFEGAISSKTTDANGIASVYYISENMAGTLTALNVPVTVTVNNPARNLVGSDRIYVTFAPGFVEGVVTEGGVPVVGAIVKVFKDFDGDGITDFSFEQITGADGSIRLQFL
jgi:hypothetical protein